MTVVVCFNVGLTGAVMVADSRLSYHGTDGQIITVRDSCQKIFIPSPWSLVGFAADDLCLGNDFARIFFQRIQATEWSEETWLDNDDEVKELALSCRPAHEALGGHHVQCATYSAGLLIAWLGRIRFNKSDGTLDHFELGTHALSIQSDGTLERQQLAALVIGSGAVIGPDLTIEAGLKVSNQADATQQIFMSLVVTQSLLDKHRIPDVGGLLQAAHLRRDGGVHLIPYFYWAPVTRRFGTYVAMRVEDGRWVQEHRPSGRSLTIRRPGEILTEDGVWPLNKNEAFDPRLQLYNTSKGVFQPAALHLAYAVYDPAAVPESVSAPHSWGPEPLRAVTFDSTTPSPEAR